MQNKNYELVRAAVIKAVPKLSGKHIFNPGRATCIFCDIPMKWVDRNVHLETQIIEEGGGSSQEVTMTEYNEEGKFCPKNQSSILPQDILKITPSLWMMKWGGERYEFVNMRDFGSKKFKNEYFGWKDAPLEEQTEFSVNALAALLQEKS